MDTATIRNDSLEEIKSIKMFVNNKNSKTVTKMCISILPAVISWQSHQLCRRQINTNCRWQTGRKDRLLFVSAANQYITFKTH